MHLRHSYGDVAERPRRAEDQVRSTPKEVSRLILGVLLGGLPLALAVIFVAVTDRDWHRALGVCAALLALLVSLFIGSSFRKAVARTATPGADQMKEAVGTRLDLKGVDLAGAHLIAADLLGADLANACLDGANLSHARLQRALLSDAQLVDANLQHAQLTGADLRNADLTRADLTRADLTGANLSCAKLQGALLQDTDFKGAVFEETDLRLVDLTGANFQGAALRSPDVRATEWEQLFQSEEEVKASAPIINKRSILELITEAASLSLNRFRGWKA
jgi:uncharacterized protein YjbI with pentapeptide repeats